MGKEDMIQTGKIVVINYDALPETWLPGFHFERAMSVQPLDHGKTLKSLDAVIIACNSHRDYDRIAEKQKKNPGLAVVCITDSTAVTERSANDELSIVCVGSKTKEHDLLAAVNRAIEVTKNKRAA